MWTLWRAARTPLGAAAHTNGLDLIVAGTCAACSCAAHTRAHVITLQAQTAAAPWLPL